LKNVLLRRSAYSSQAEHNDSSIAVDWSKELILVSARELFCPPIKRCAYLTIDSLFCSPNPKKTPRMKIAIITENWLPVSIMAKMNGLEL
jgi:hypothetical protein